MVEYWGGGEGAGGDVSDDLGREVSNTAVSLLISAARLSYVLPTERQ